MQRALKLTITPRALNRYVRWLVKGIPFAFSRWGDGEWSAVLGKGKCNTDKQFYTPALRADLRGVLEARPSYLLGLQPAAVRLYGVEIAEWLRARDWWPAWDDADVWHRASKRGELGPLVKALRSRRVLIVGPARLRALTLFPCVGVVEIPDQGAHSGMASMRADLAAALDRLGPDGVVALSAGMCANLLIHDYCGTPRVATAPPRTTWIDFGAVWEPYVGVANRTYHKALIERLARSTEP